MQNSPASRGPWRLTVIVGAWIALLFAGCASTNRTALAPTARSSLKEVTVATVANQPEVAADIDQSNITTATGGGLLFALIDAGINAHRAKKAENVITPLRDALIDFKAPDALLQSVSAQFKSANAPLPVTNISVVEAKQEEDLRKLAKNTGEAVLVISVDYRLSSDFHRVRVLTHASLYSAMAGAAGLIYQNDFATYRSLPGIAMADPAACIGQWADNKGAAMRAALQECFAETAAMLAFDLGRGAEDNMPPKEQLTAMAPPAGRMGAVQGMAMRGAIAREADGRRWVRLQSGELSSTD